MASARRCTKKRTVQLRRQAKRFDRVERRRFPGRVVAEEHADGAGEADRDLHVGVSIGLGGVFRDGSIYVDTVNWPTDSMVNLEQNELTV